jgi:hypothetical protein
MNQTVVNIALFFAFVGLLACTKVENLAFYDGPGKRPVYLSFEATKDIRNDTPRAIQKSGKVFVNDTLMFILEQYRGIHVFNVRDSIRFASLTFFNIPAITDFSINDSTLYVDNWKDLVSIDISNIFRIRETGRATNVFQQNTFPPAPYNGAFECVDESKGAVIGWEDATLVDAKCENYR